MFASDKKSTGRQPATAEKDKGSRKPQAEANSVWQSLATRALIQPKLTVSQPDDPYEREADQIADRVTRIASPLSLKLQRKCGPCEAEEEDRHLQRASAEHTARSVGDDSSTVNDVLTSQGQPLDHATRGFMEHRFGYDFGEIRVHTDSRAAESAAAVNALAYTVGNHIGFAADQYAPNTSRGSTLLAHELVHSLQQNSGADRMIQRQEPTPLDLLLQGIGQLPQVRLEDFCQPWPTVDEARRVHNIAVRNFLPALTGQFGPEVGNLWRLYLNRRHGASLTRLVFSDPAHRITAAFAQSQTIRDRQTRLRQLAEDWYRRTCPSLPANFPLGIPAAQIFAASELTFPINFNVPTEIPGHIAGGVGSSDAGPDTRRMAGSIIFFRSTDSDSHTTEVRARTELQFTVDDAIDFCPGDPGTGMEQLLTTPLSRLERSGEVWPAETLAYDVPFEVRFTGEPLTWNIDSALVRACDPQARPTPPPQSPQPAPPSPPQPPEQPGRTRFRKVAEGAPRTSLLSNLAVSKPGDPHEREADEVAERVMRLAPAEVDRSPTKIPIQPGMIAISAAPLQVSRAPRSTEELHAGLIEDYRHANGLPPHGVDPVTHEQVGPTDSQIRFGGLLEAWLASRRQPATAQAPAGTPATPQPATVRSVPAPAQAPTIVPRGTTSVVSGCQGVPDFGACRTHQNYVQNIMPQTIANIRNVSSPYSAAIADLYQATLPAARTAPAPTPANPPATFGRSSPARAAGPVAVSFGGTTFTFQHFEVGLQQFPNGVNGQAFGIGTPIAFINLNEMSNDALFGNIAGIEATMVHEMMHILMAVVERQNAARPQGSAPTNRNLDRASYAAIETGLETELLPLVTQIRQFPSFTGNPAPLTPQDDATATAESFLSETIARTEAGIFANQRAGQAFTAADLRTLPRFIRTADYWSPTPPARPELVSFLTANQALLDTRIQPLIYQAGEQYLNLRP